MGYESLLRCAGHARVLLTGLPADGLLMFVPWYWIEWLAQGRLLRLARAWVGNARLFHVRPHPHVKQSATVAIAAIRGSRPTPPIWLAPDFARRIGAEARMRPLMAARASGVDARSIGRDPGWTAVFTWCSPSCHRVPIQIRHPLADLRLLDFVARLPPEPWLLRKRILREATRDLLPEAVLARPKTLLVSGRRASITPQVLDRLAELVRALPELERFLDSSALIETLTAPDAELNQVDNVFLSQALGLVYWSAHWRRPTANDLGSGGRFGLMSNLEEVSGERSTDRGQVTFR
jgi:hypothetical protein